MNNLERDTADISKLHAESLQLRNQQFHIVTIALASTGISAWIVPGITSLIDSGNEPLGETMVLFATLSWLLLLGILFFWSLALKRLIDIIARYIKKNNLSNWEESFHRFDNEKKLHIGQTKYSFFIFVVYGFIVSVSGYLAISQEGYTISWGQGGVLILFLLYWVICWYRYNNRSKRQEIKDAWNDVLD